MESNDPSAFAPTDPSSRSLQPLLALAVVGGLVGIGIWLAFTARRGLVDHDAPPAATAKFTVDINTADAEELAQLPGLGPTIAARIIAHRASHGPFTAPEALLDVPGIGLATLAAIRPHLCPLDSQ